MSLYNMVNGINPVAGDVLGMLKLTPDDFGRFRDSYITRDGELAVYTRCGGGNREYYEEVFTKIAEHSNFLRDEDDDFDCTYATFFFSVPDEYKEDVKTFLEMVKEKEREDLVTTPAEKFQQAIENLK